MGLAKVDVPYNIMIKCDYDFQSITNNKNDINTKNGDRYTHVAKWI